MKSSNPNPAFSRNIRAIRENNDMTIDEFCAAFNSKYDSKLNKSTVSRWENNLQEPMVSTAFRIADFWGVDPLELIGQDAKPKADPMEEELLKTFRESPAPQKLKIIQAIMNAIGGDQHEK